MGSRPKAFVDKIYYRIGEVGRITGVKPHVLRYWESEFKEILTNVGFVDVDIEPTRIFDIDDARTFLGEGGGDIESIGPEMDGKFMSAFVRGQKPRGP